MIQSHSILFLGNGYDDRANVVASLFVVLVVLSIAKWEGSTLPAATIYCFLSSLQSNLKKSVVSERG
jgi:hypothetical protein